MKLKLISLLTAVGLLASLLVPAQAQTPSMGTGVIFTTTNTAGPNTNTTLQTLTTYLLPAGIMNVPGKKLRITADWKHAANTNLKTGECYFGNGVGSIKIGTQGNNGANLNGNNGMCQLIVTETITPTVQNVYGYIMVGNTLTTTNTIAQLSPTAAAIPIWFGATDGTASANDIILEDLTVELLN